MNIYPTFENSLKSRLATAFIALAICAVPQLTSAQVISTAAGNGVLGDKAATLAIPGPSAELSLPGGLAFDTAGNLYIGDQVNNIVRKLDTTGIITTISGIPGDEGDDGDGGLATVARLSSPVGVAVDADGNIYIADDEADRIRKITVATGIIETVAGTGNFGFSGDGGLATDAQLDRPSDIALDAAGNMYIADFLNHRIRKVDVATGIITTIAGTFGGGDTGEGGPATAARLFRPVGVAIDLAGNVLISDGGNNKIKMVDQTTGVITTIAGDGTGAFEGDGGLATDARVDGPRGLHVDAAGNIYIGDADNNRVRKIDAVTGFISTIAGGPNAGFSGDYGDPLLAELDMPWDVAVSPTGETFITDLNNNRVRKIAPASLNNVPTNIVTTNTVAGKIIANSAGTMNQDITTFTTTDADGGNHYYTLSAGPGDQHNFRFVIPTTNTPMNDDLLIRDSTVMASGDYFVRVQTDDYNGGVYSEAMIVTLLKTNDPAIVLIGDNPQLISAGDPYVELGATATDSNGVDITGSLVIDASAVDTMTLGDYNVTYDVMDGNGNGAPTVTRVVTVGLDVTVPVITINGASPQVITVGVAYTELGATAMDNLDGDISANIVIDSSAVNTAIAGTYMVTYNVMDAAGNPAATIARTVTVQAAPPPPPPPPSSSGGGSFGVVGLMFLSVLMARRRRLAGA